MPDSCEPLQRLILRKNQFDQVFWLAVSWRKTVGSEKGVILIAFGATDFESNQSLAENHLTSAADIIREAGRPQSPLSVQLQPYSGWVILLVAGCTASRTDACASFVVPPPMDWMEYIHVTGYWQLDNADASGQVWQPPQDLLDFMTRARKAERKLVYIGFGSIVVSDPAALTKLVLEAVQAADVWAIISKGWSDRIAGKADNSDEVQLAKQERDAEEIRSLPEHVFNISSIPHDWLFPRVDAVCHHG